MLIEIIGNVIIGGELAALVALIVN